MCAIATIILKHALSKCLISGARCYPFSTACRYIINGRQVEWLVSGCAKSVCGRRRRCGRVSSCHNTQLLTANWTGLSRGLCTGMTESTNEQRTAKERSIVSPVQRATINSQTNKAWRSVNRNIYLAVGRIRNDERLEPHQLQSREG